jgi:hypothetical protein
MRKFNPHAANLRTATQGGVVPPKVLAWAADEIERLDDVNGKLVRALLEAEGHMDDFGDRQCCGMPGSVPHDEDCSLVAALAAAGFPTQKERDEARAEIAKETDNG